MILSAKQINELIELVKNLHLVFIGKNVGTKYLPDSSLKILKEYGLNKKLVTSYPEHAFQFGMLSMALGDNRAKKLDYSGLKKFITSGQWLPLTKAETYGLSLIENRLIDGLTGLGNKVSADLKTIFIEADLKQRERFEKIIRNEAKHIFSERKGIKSLVSVLGEKTGDWARDFARISDFVLHEAYDNGRAYALLRSEGEDVLVYKRVHGGVCESCMELYLDYVDKKYRPRIFKLKELLRNGTNIGRKKEDWLPVIGATHPWCRCDLEYVPKNSEWSDDKKTFVVSRSEAAKRLKLKKFIKIKIEKV